VTTVDPTIRSIRIATTLNDRFGVILREAQSSNQSVADFELRIGEAQQLYPEIWRHLDEARTALRQRGIAVGDYDALRATERPGELGVSNIESSEGVSPIGLAFGQLDYGETKTATFNAEGHAKARHACIALMEAMPDVDWNALAKEEDAEIAAMGSLNAGKWRTVAIAAAVLLVVLVLVKVLV
jgi:hypothetical protein